MIKIAVKRFMDNYFSNYTNPNEIEIARLTDNSFCISGFWPKEQLEENVSVVSVVTCDDYAGFIETFKAIRDLQESSDNLNKAIDNLKESLDSITIGTLMNLYRTGKGSISCSIDGVNAPNLEFYKRNGRIMAKDEFETVHDVGMALNTPEDFIRYTERYYELNAHLAGYATLKNWPWKLSIQ